MKDNKERINELALQLKNGDKSVFEELYKLTSSKAYFLAFQICGNEHEAEDIVQDSYVAMLDRIGTLEKSESFMSWFNRIVANRSKDCLKKKKPRLFDDGEEKAFAVIPDETGEFSPEENVDRDELRTAVMDAVRELSADKRACVLMRYYENMSVNDIAESMEIPVSTVKNRLMRARKDLKSVFERKGITAAYSVAPLGVVTWAVNATYEIVSQSFENSHAAAKIFSGIAVAGTAAATGAAATAGTTAAAGTGIAAKAAAATTLQKVVSGLVVAGVVTGSTIGITSVVKNRKHKDEIPTTSYSETVEEAVVPKQDVTPVVNEVKVDSQEEAERYETKLLEYNRPNIMDFRVNYIGEVKLGDNRVVFEDRNTYYYVYFNTEESGYYSFECDYVDSDDFCYVLAPEDPQGDNFDAYLYTEIIQNMSGMCLFYLEKGRNLLLINRDLDFDSTNIRIEYLGEEIEDIVFEQRRLDNVVIGYNEIFGELNQYQLAQTLAYEEDLYCNFFDFDIVFSSGKTLHFDKSVLNYTVEGGLKEGKNTAVFTLYGKNYKRQITAHPINYYVKDIEISNLEEFTIAKIGEGGFIYEEPEEYEVTVTYGDGSKETFDGKTWDRTIKLDCGVELVVEFKTTEIRDRDALRFAVAIGDYEYINLLCIVNEVDFIGYRKTLNKNNVATLKEYKEHVKNMYEITGINSKNPEEYIWYIEEAFEASVYYTFKSIDRIAGFELDYAITTYKIITENEFDLF